MTRQKAFWDASALVPLCAGQSTTPQVIALSYRYDAVIWWATPVELAAALARLARMRILSSDEASQAQGLAKKLAEWWLVIEPSQALRTRATEIVERYDLRAADSLQLAAALEWCGDAPQTRVFLAADKRLREAALRSGFDAQQV